MRIIYKFTKIDIYEKRSVLTVVHNRFKVVVYTGSADGGFSRA